MKQLEIGQPVSHIAKTWRWLGIQTGGCPTLKIKKVSLIMEHLLSLVKITSFHNFNQLLNAALLKLIDYLPDQRFLSSGKLLWLCIIVVSEIFFKVRKHKAYKFLIYQHSFIFLPFQLSFCGKSFIFDVILQSWKTPQNRCKAHKHTNPYRKDSDVYLGSSDSRW